MRILLAILAVLSLPTLAVGQTVCRKPVTRYLDIVSVKTLRSILLQNLHSFGTAFVFEDGSYLSSAVNGLSFQQNPIAASRGQIARATSSSVSFADLRRAANKARVGVQGPCQLVRQGGEESYFVKWYGKNGRTNLFGVNSEAIGPECPPEVVAFVDLLLRYVNVESSPGERFVTP
jgi:hypothetical protein